MNGVLRLLSGDPALFGGPLFSPEDAARARTEQVNSICRYTRPIMIGNACSAIGFAAAELPTPDRNGALAWAGLLIFIAFFHYLKATRPRRPDITISLRTVRRAVLNAFVMGAAWSLLPALFFQTAPEANKLFIISLCTGLACIGAFVLASLPIAAFAFMMPVVGAITFTLLREGHGLYWVISALMFLYLFLLMRAAVTQGIQNLHHLADKFQAERKATTDPLTGLPNRTGLRTRFAELARGTGKAFALLYLDLDRFKTINDELGHATGDEVLSQFAERLKTCAAEGDLVARIGGDEFVILSPGAATAQAAEQLAQRIIAATSARYTVADRSLTTLTSIGIALAPADARHPDDLLHKADEALYEAKRAGRGIFRFYNSEARHASVWHARLADELPFALQADEIFVEYQPIFSAATGAISGFEALARWSHPELGSIPPSVFIAIAETNGLMDALGDRVLEQACAAAVSWPQDLRLAINWSASQFQSDGVADRTLAILGRHGLSPHRLEIEITEQVPLQTSAAQAGAVDALTRAGIGFSLDDFGTGYSSLTALRRLHFSRLKIDRSFVMDALSDDACRRIVEGTITFAHGLGLTVVAEGIETREQLDMLRASGCDEIQGFLVGRPMSALRALQSAQSQTSFAPAVLERLCS